MTKILATPFIIKIHAGIFTFEGELDEIYPAVRGKEFEWNIPGNREINIYGRLKVSVHILFFNPSYTIEATLCVR